MLMVNAAYDPIFLTISLTVSDPSGSITFF